MSYGVPPDPNVVLTNFNYIATVMGDFGIVAGLCLAVISFNQFKKHGESRSHGGGQGGITQPIATMISAIMLLFLPLMITSIGYIFFQTDSDMAYQGGNTGVDAWCDVVIVFTRIIGVGAMMKGIIHLSRMGGQNSQPGSVGKALIHLFGGVLCVHILGTIGFVEQLLGFAN